jgi:lysophospholipase L1-like esterase
MLIKETLAMPHMAATGVSGVDLYARDDKGQWKWVAVGKPTAKTNTMTVSGVKAGEREYLLYFPLYNGVEKLEVGVKPNTKFSAGPVRDEKHAKPILFWGTSITHGACASRPGMCHPAILGRWFDRPVINLGFSGNGKMDPEVTALIAELDPAVYIIDCLPNMNDKGVTERTEPLVTTLRKAHPDTPILLVEDRNYADSWIMDSKAQHNSTSQAALKAAYQKLQAAGVKNLFYLEGKELLGDDRDDTVDSSHPSDLGFERQARAFEKVLKEILK